MKLRLRKQKDSSIVIDDDMNAKLDYATAGESLAMVANHYGRGRRRFQRAVLLGLAAFAFVGGAFAITGQETVKAAACAAPTADLGTDTLELKDGNAIPQDGDYIIWTRMVAPDAANNSINLQVDQTDCYNVGGGTFAAATWQNSAVNWVNYANGTPSATVKVHLTKGNHTLKFVGTKSGVLVDKVIVTASETLKPTGTCSDCLSGDTTPPTVNITPPQPATNVLGNIALQVTAADASGIAKVDFMVDGQIIYTDTTAPYSFDWNTASVQNGAHELKAQATDTEGNTASSTPVTITTNNIVICTAAPSVPANLRVSGASGTSVTLAWDASTPGDQCQIKNYRVFRDGTQVSTAQGTTFSDAGLTPGGSHVYTVAAVDLSDHVSAQSAPATGTTSDDSTAPTVPADVRTSLVTANSVSLTWTASTDNNAVASYVVYRSGAQVGTTTTNSYTDSAVEPNKDYSYTIAAKDSAGNLSGQSAAVAAKTLQGQAANPNKMYISPASGTLNKAAVSEFTVDVMVNTNAMPVNAAQADIAFTNLEFVGINDAGSAYDISAVKGLEGGVIHIARGSLSAGPLTGDKFLAKITFKLLATGEAKIDIQDSSIALSSDTNTDVLTAREDGTFTIVDQPATTNNGGGSGAGAGAGAGTGSTGTGGNSNSGSTGSGSDTTTDSGSTGSSNSTPTPVSTTTIAPEGSTQPVTLPNDAEVELSDPVVIQTVPDSSQTTEKVEYYLNGKLIATVKEPPYSYTVNTKNMKNGTYTLTTKTYYQDGQIETKNATLVVKNPLSFRQVMLQIGGFAWVIILVLVIAAGAVWYFYFRNRDGGSDDYSDTDGYMFGPTGQNGGPSGDNFGPPAQFSKLLSQFQPIVAYETVSLDRY